MLDRDPSDSKRPKSSTLLPWETIDSKELLVAAPWIKVEQQRVRLPDGSVVNDYHRISLLEYVNVFAQTTDGKVILERQYKQGLGRVTLTMPAGSIEAGERPLSAARRELLEETGYVSDDWESLGAYVVSGNYGCGKSHLFKARDAYQVAEPNSGDLEEMEIVTMTPAEIADSIREGHLSLLSTLASIAVATNPLLMNIGVKQD